jgi:hypothetical protein
LDHLVRRPVGRGADHAVEVDKNVASLPSLVDDDDGVERPGGLGLAQMAEVDILGRQRLMANAERSSPPSTPA